jgi:hypothetical protein
VYLAIPAAFAEKIVFLGHIALAPWSKLVNYIYKRLWFIYFFPFLLLSSKQHLLHAFPTSLSCLPTKAY